MSDSATRMAAILGDPYREASLAIDELHPVFSLTGSVALPRYSRAGRDQQYLFVNGRFVSS